MAALWSDDVATGRDETPVRMHAPTVPPTPESPLYEERVSAGGLQRAIIFGAAGIFAAAAFMAPGVEGGNRLVLTSAFLGLASLVLIVGWVFKDIEVRLWPDRLTIQQGVFTRRVPIEQVRDASFGKRSLWRVKRDNGDLTRNNAAYYVNRFGTAVIVERDTGAPLVFSSHRPRDMVEAIVRAVHGQERVPHQVGIEHEDSQPLR